MAGNKQKKKRGRPPRHGGFSLIAKDELLKDQPHIRQYLLDCRAGLVLCVSESEEMLTEQQRILIDRIINKISICRLIDVSGHREGANNGNDGFVNGSGQVDLSVNHRCLGRFDT